MDLMQGNCLELMAKIPAGSVDMILTDLPYGMTRCTWDIPLPLPELWKEFYRIAKPTAAIVLHCMQPFTSKLVSSNLKDFKYAWVWKKNNPRNFLNAKIQPLRDIEDIAVFYRKQCTYNPQMRSGKVHDRQGGSTKQWEGYGTFGRNNPMRTAIYYPTQILDFKVVPTSQLAHFTQKPVPLLEYLIKTYTDPGEVVLDCCMGSGSTGVAAVQTGRDFIGIELDPEFYQIAKERIDVAIQVAA